MPDVRYRLARLKRSHILRAIKEQERLGLVEFRRLYRFGRAKSRFLIFNNKPYDAKAIVGVAVKFLPDSNGPLTHDQFHGGNQPTKILRSLGFEVHDERFGSLTLPPSAADQTVFDPKNLRDGRDFVRRTIVQRRGQQKFRSSLMVAYDRCCAVTNSSSEAVLEAAHITPYFGSDTNHVSNGILLRADIHTLFDLDLIKIKPKTHKIEVHQSILDAEYRKLDGKELRRPVQQRDWPSFRALKCRYDSAGS